MATRRRRATPARRRSATSRRASRSVRSARGRREFGKPLAPSWKTANYAYPNGVGPDRGKRPSYPISPARRVPAALSYAGRRNTAGSSSHVRWAVRQRYGSVSRALALARSSRRRGR